MDNATKNKLTSGTDQADLTTGNACWETPPLVFAKLNEDFGPFDVDLTADDHGRVVADPAVFDSIVVRYEPGASMLNVDLWHVPKHVMSEDLARAVERRKAAA
jgi:hypothetical protein